MSSPVASIHGVDREHELINAIAGQTTPKLRLDCLDEGLKINAAGNGVREGLHLSMLNRIPFLRAEPELHLDRRPRPIIFGASHLEPLKAAFALSELDNGFANPLLVFRSPRRPCHPNSRLNAQQQAGLSPSRAPRRTRGHTPDRN
jgi:hypothetical protein